MKDDQIRWVPVLMVSCGGFVFVLGILFIHYYFSIPAELLKAVMIFLASMPLLLGLLYMMVRDVARSIIRIRDQYSQARRSTNKPFNIEALRNVAEKVDPEILRELGMPRLEDLDYEAEKEKWKHVRETHQRVRLTASRLYIALLTIPFVALALYFGMSLVGIVQQEDISKHLYNITTTTTDEPFRVLFTTAIFTLGFLGCLYMAAVMVLMQITYPYALFKKGR